MQSIITHASYRPSLSNSFEPVSDITAGLSNGTFTAIHDSHPVILLKHCEGFCKVYYFLETQDLSGADWDSLAKNIRQASGGLPVYGEVTLRGDFAFSGSVFEKLGMHPFRTYIRRSMKTPAKTFREYMTSEYAAQEDAQSIYELIYSTENFDPMADHLPTRHELDDMIHKKFVLKTEYKNELAGIFIFEDTGIKTYGAVLCVSKKLRGNIIGYSIYAHYINIHLEKSEMFYTWVDQDNKPSIGLQNYFGFRDDGVKNFIFRM